MQIDNKAQKEFESQLDQLKRYTRVGLCMAQTSDINDIDKFQSDDSSTNPNLIMQMSKHPNFQNILKDSIQFGLNNFKIYCGLESEYSQKEEKNRVSWDKLSEKQREKLIDLTYDHLSVHFGVKFLERVKGFVSIQIDAKLSFDKNETVKRAKRIIQLFQLAGASTQRVLIKLGATWECIKAAEELGKEDIKSLLTLVFHKMQAIACGEAKIFCISPFAGRIRDWHMKEYNKTYQNAAEDPGVLAVTEIYNYFKHFDVETILMVNSFRSTAIIKEFCGCDRVTIPPKMLEELNVAQGEVPVKLSVSKAKAMKITRIDASEQNFRYEMNKSKMATDLLSEAVRNFENNINRVKQVIRYRLWNSTLLHLQAFTMIDPKTDIDNYLKFDQVTFEKSKLFMVFIFFHS